MKLVEMIWVTSGRHPETEALICKATKSRFGHAAIRMEIPGRGVCICEAIRPVAQIVENPNYFDGATAIEILPVEVTDEQWEKIVARALECENKPYGVDSCIVGGLHDLTEQVFGNNVADHVAGMVDRAIDNPDHRNCSEMQTYMMQGGFPDYAGDREITTITPEGSRKMAWPYFCEGVCAPQ